MTAVAIKTFDAMEAPEWSGLRSQPPIEIRTNILDAPPVPAQFLHPSNALISDVRPANEALNIITEPVPTIALPTVPPPLPPRLRQLPKPEAIEETFNETEEAWFADCLLDEVVESTPIYSYEDVEGPQMGASPIHYWIGAMMGFTVISVAWTSIAVILFRDL